MAQKQFFLEMSASSNSLLIGGMINSRCNFSTHPDCNLYFSMAFFIISLFVCLPYSYNCIVQLRKKLFTREKKLDHGIEFCFISFINEAVFSISYCTNIHFFTDLSVTKVRYIILLIRTLQTFSITLYFYDILKILIIFKIKIGNILAWLSISLMTVLGAFSFFYLHLFIFRKHEN